MSQSSQRKLDIDISGYFCFAYCFQISGRFLSFWTGILRRPLRYAPVTDFSFISTLEPFPATTCHRLSSSRIGIHIASQPPASYLRHAPLQSENFPNRGDASMWQVTFRCPADAIILGSSEYRPHQQVRNQSELCGFSAFTGQCPCRSGKRQIVSLHPAKTESALISFKICSPISSCVSVSSSPCKNFCSLSIENAASSAIFSLHSYRKRTFPISDLYIRNME